MGSFWSRDEKEYQPVKYDEESQQTTTKQRNPNNTCCIEQEPRKRINKESGMSLRKFMSSFWSGVDKKDPQVKDDEESLEATTKRMNQNSTCSIEVETLKRIHNDSDINQSQNVSNTDHQDDLMKQKDLKILALEEQVNKLTEERESLAIRLSQICCLKLTDGNPNITDLSDPNRADKLVGRFSELYDNQWTDAFQELCERRHIVEENAIPDLLQIVLNVYKFCQEYAECQNQELVKAVQSFTGVKITTRRVLSYLQHLDKHNYIVVKQFGEDSVKDILNYNNVIHQWSYGIFWIIWDLIHKVGDKVEAEIVQEFMHNLHIFRAKNYALKMADVKEEISNSLKSIVDPDVCEICQDYIAECTEVCWLMCVKSPPMYISADKTDTFQHHLYSGYTASGKYVSYVVWPTLFQYKDGPIMQRGVAQGTNNKI